MPTVAIASEFLDAFARIPRAQQKKVREFTEKFRANPKSSAINYEKIHTAKDDKVRTVRIDQKYRAVVLHPDQGDVYLLTWVDNHDDAMAWAANRTFDINPVTGALQVVNVTEVEQAVPAHGGKKQPGLLSAFEDEQLLSFAVPAILLPAVRAVRTPEELLALNKHLPAEAAEALMWLGEGMPPDEVRAAVTTTPKKEPVNTSDLAKALEHPDSRRRFVTIQSDHDLTAMLDAPLEKWRLFLHPSQEKLVAKTFNGPARVLGGAGTGKTVVAMHRAKYLASTLFTAPNDKVLFTTYTANLAQNVEEMLSTLCPDCMTRIEVVHLHAWAMRFMRDQGHRFDIAYGNDLDACWEQAYLEADETEFDLGFLRQEWEQVVQANGIETQAEYLQVARTGRGKTLTRPQRGRVWKVFEQYLKVLEGRGQMEWLQAIRATRRFLEEKKPSLPFRAVVIDEGQDFHAEEWKLIRALVPSGANDLFLVGDAHQRIYGRKISLARCGVQIQGRSSKLRINYRTTEQIRAWATAMLQGVEVDDLDGGRDDEAGYKALLSGPKPEVHHFATREQEREFLGQRLKELVKERRPEDICLVARTTKQVKEDYQSMLKRLGMQHTLLEKNKEGAGGGVRLATMHRVKGLEYPVMILAGVNARVVPLYVAAVEGDPTSKAEHDDRERSILFVAATRARDMMIVTSWGTTSPFLPKKEETEEASASKSSGRTRKNDEMRHNTDPSFKGIDAIKKKQEEWLTLFKTWASEGRWAMFHHEHYDWWMFPIDEKGSSCGLEWTVYEGDIARLKQDAGYIQNYLEGVRLLALSWGWDLAAQDYIANPKPEQSWQKWPVRLQKAAKSLKQFGFADQFGSLKKYAKELINRGEDMTFKGRDLSKLFKE